MIKSILGMLLACLPCSSVLYAQGFCSDVIELPDCFISPPCAPNSAGVSCEVQLRYSLNVVPWVSPAPFESGLAVDNTNCDPTFYFDIKKSSEDFANTLNSELANWNQAGNLAFFKGPNARSLTFLMILVRRWQLTNLWGTIFLAALTLSYFPGLVIRR